MGQNSAVIVEQSLYNKGLDKMSIYDKLNDMQKKAVFQVEGPLLILAGAGSGKTGVLTHRIAYLIEECGVNPWNIMAITFTNKAAAEMRERVDNIVGFGSESIWVSTFHSSCVRILRRYIDRLGYDNNFSIYDADDQKTLIKGVCKRLNIDTKNLKEKKILNVISSCKNEGITPEQYALENQGDYGKKQLVEAYREYQQELKKNNALDFDDLLVLTVELFKANPDVLEHYQERFKYIMVDEYQDTNTIQFLFVSLLAGKYKNLCVVGDDDQSIYRFRGANINNILNFEKIFDNAMVIKLEQNYRSVGNILAAANGVISNNTERKSKSLWTDKEDGDKIVFRQVDTAYTEAEIVAADIEKLVESGRYKYSDFACLYRTNAQSRILEEKFLRTNIPYKIVGGINFYQRKEIKDMLAYLRTIDNGLDDLSVKRIINIPKRGIGATTISKVEEYAYRHAISFYDALTDADNISTISRAASKIKPFVTFIQTLKSKLESGYVHISDVMEEILETTGYVRELEAEDTEESRGRIENINELFSKIVDYEESAEHPTLSEFLEEVALVSDIDSLDDNADYVVLMTVHGAKGLEFPKVYLCGMEDGLFPSYMTITSDDPSEVEEERRLCYVGITRAMNELMITSAQSRMVRGEMQYSKVSRFVKEIPSDLLDTNLAAGKMCEESETVRNYAYSPSKPIMKQKPFSKDMYKVTRLTSLDYEEGDAVKHVKFGNGIVLSIAEGGRDYEVTVDFEKYGVKKMFASFAKLKKV